MSATKRMLAISLKELLKKSTIDSITIQMITDNAGVSRKTFYYHFQDIYDLLEWTLFDDFARIVAGNTTIDTWHQGLFNVFSYCKINRELVMNTFNSVRYVALEDYICRMIMPVVDTIVRKEEGYECLEEDDREFIKTVYCYGITGLLMHWVSDDMKTEPDYLVSKIDKFFTGSMQTMFSQAALAEKQDK